MYNLLISIAASILVYVLTNQLGLDWWQALPPALMVLIALYLYLSRRLWKQVELQIKDAYKILEPFSQRTDLAHQVDKRNTLIDEAIKKIKLGYRLAKWQFLVKSQLDAQIGIILFSVKQDLSGALPYLEKAKNGRNWQAQAMLAVVYMKKHKPELMSETFEFAVRLNKKQDLLWNLYAFCLQKIKQQEKAIEVLIRAKKILPANKPIIDNLVLLQNNKKMKMKAYGEQWYQFQLEKPPMQKTKKPRFSRR